MTKSRSSRKRGLGVPVEEEPPPPPPEDTEPSEPPPPMGQPAREPKPAAKPRVVPIKTEREITVKEWRGGKSGLHEAFWTCERLLHPKQNRKLTRTAWNAEFSKWKSQPRG